MFLARLFCRLVWLAAAAACCCALNVDTAVAQTPARQSINLSAGGRVLYTKWIASDSLLACSYNSSAERLSFTLLERSSADTWNERRRWHQPLAAVLLAAAPIANTDNYTTAALMYRPANMDLPLTYVVHVLSLPEDDSTVTVSADTTVEFALPPATGLELASQRVHVWSAPSDDLYIAVQASGIFIRTELFKIEGPYFNYSMMRYRPSEQTFFSDFAYPDSLLHQARPLSFIGVTDNGYLLQGTDDGIRAFVSDTARVLTSSPAPDTLFMQWDNTLFAAHSPTGVLRVDGSWVGFESPGGRLLQSLRVGNTIAVLRRELDTPVVFFDAFSGVRTGAIDGIDSIPYSIDVSPQHDRLAIVCNYAYIELIELPAPAIQSASLACPQVFAVDSSYDATVSTGPATEPDDIAWRLDGGSAVGTGHTLALSVASEGLHIARAFIGDSGSYRASPGAIIYALPATDTRVDVAEEATGAPYGMAVYPNPASSAVRIDLRHAFRSLYVATLDGRRVYSADLRGRTSLSWDLVAESGSRLSPGFYLVAAITAEGSAVVVPLTVTP